MTKIGFIGAGNMARSLAGGLIAQGIQASDILMSDPHQAALDALHHTLQVNITSDNHRVVAESDVVILAVKPQVMKNVVETVQSSAQKYRPLFISIAAGIPCESLLQWLGDDVPLIRCMPNTPALIRAAATGLYATSQVSEQQKQTADAILKAVGLTVWVAQENLLDAVTAVSGSGPAYFFYLMEAMIQAGVQLGLSEEVSKALTLQTAVGAAQMAQTSEFNPAQLRAQVTSPGGTTAAAIAVFDQHQSQENIIQALQAADQRAKTLAESLK